MESQVLWSGPDPMEDEVFGLVLLQSLGKRGSLALFFSSPWERCGSLA